MVEVRKMKGEEIDFYDCRGCGKRWKQTAKTIGHSQQACDRYHKKTYGWV